jgi:hypothetical protein
MSTCLALRVFQQHTAAVTVHFNSNGIFALEAQGIINLFFLLSSHLQPLVQKSSHYIILYLLPRSSHPVHIRITTQCICTALVPGPEITLAQFQVSIVVVRSVSANLSWIHVNWRVAYSSDVVGEALMTNLAIEITTLYFRWYRWFR